MKTYINKIALSVTMLALVFNTLNVKAQSGDIDNNSNNACVTIDNNLRYKMRDASVNGEVTDLQDYLIAEGYMSGQTTGYFGAGTLKAVKLFQAQNSLISSGYVGPVTRAKIKELSCSISSISNPNPVVTNPIVITPNYPGMLNITYFTYNGASNKCLSGVFVGNTGPRVNNGQYVYQSGEYESDEKCKSANPYNTSVPPTVASKKINITSAYIQQINDNQVNLFVYGSGFKNGSQIQLAGCEGGSHESLSSNSDTETSVGFDKSYFFACIGQRPSATLIITGYNGVDNSNAYTVSVPAQISSDATSIKAYNVLGNEIGNGPIYYNLMYNDANAQNSRTLSKLDIVKGQYQSIEVKYSCGTMTDSNNAQTSNYGLRGVFFYGGSATYGAFNCPEGVNMMKGGSDIVTIGNIVKDVDSLSYRIDYKDSNVDGSKKMPTGELYFYGVDKSGNKTLIKSITFLYSMKG